MRIILTEQKLNSIIKKAVKQTLMNENDFHRGFKSGRNLDVIKSTDGTYTDSDIWQTLEELKELLHQAEERAKTGYYDEGTRRNYLVGAIKGLQAFIDSNN